MKEIRGEEQIYRNLYTLIFKDEIYTSGDTSLNALSKILNTNTSYLSSIINTRFQCNLKTLLNQLRVNKAKEILVSPEHKHLSMNGIATEAGFKSRSKFYQSFKKDTGLTPSEYISTYNLKNQINNKVNS